MSVPGPHAPLSGMSDVVLACTGLRRSFGELVAVDGVSFTIAAGEIYGLLGPNGAGKTTTISIVVGVLAADAGEVLIEGSRHDVRTLRTKAAIGYVPQDVAVYPDLSANENLRFFARLYGLSGARMRAATAEVLDIVGLADRADEPVAKFSGGMQRRLNIAVGLLNRPRLLVLDEPTVGVDPQSRNAILESVRRLAGEGVAVLYTSHHMEEAEALCDRVGVMDEGRIRAEGTRRELVGRTGETDRVLLTLSGNVAAAVSALRTVRSVQQAGVDQDHVDILVTDARAALPELLAAVATAGASVRSVEVREPNLEAAFLALTGKALRD